MPRQHHLHFFWQLVVDSAWVLAHTCMQSEGDFWMFYRFRSLVGNLGFYIWLFLQWLWEKRCPVCWCVCVILTCLPVVELRHFWMYTVNLLMTVWGSWDEKVKIQLLTNYRFRSLVGKLGSLGLGMAAVAVREALPSLLVCVCIILKCFPVAKLSHLLTGATWRSSAPLGGPVLCLCSHLHPRLLVMPASLWPV